MLHVLIVDDAPLYATTISRYVRNRGHQPSIATSPEQAMSALRREGSQVGRSPINLVICDHFMGTSSGLDLLQEIKADPALNPVPVLMLSNADAPELIADGYRYGCAGWMSKDRLLSAGTIDRILDYWDRCERVEI